MKHFSKIVFVFILIECTIKVFSQVSDINGHIYKTVIIGSQTWMAENLDVDKFRNGESITEAKSREEWNELLDKNQPAWCYYNYDINNRVKYGKIYNWYALNDKRGLAPENFKIPNEEDWHNLEDYLGGFGTASEKLKAAPVYDSTFEVVEKGGYYEEKWVPCSNCKNWNSEYRKKVPCHVCKDERGKYIKGNYVPKTVEKVLKETQIGGWDGNNSSKFNALPGGFCHYGGFNDSNPDMVEWWYEPCGSIALWSDNDVINFFNCNLGADDGYYVRCIKK